ncbi:DapH/DapD/GlmU-related protein [Ilumatobacter sp.]|uniref:acyltransferase n=1 Tax=Ilumatobacter sp. TaxID=1967498 RepID=UPI003B51589B
MHGRGSRPEPTSHGPAPGGGRRLGAALRGVAGELVHRGWDAACEVAAIRSGTRRGDRFGRFGAGSVICFPPTALLNERYVRIGRDTVFGPGMTLSAGMGEGQRMVTDPVVEIGDRCLFGKGSAIVGHLEIRIGDDVWTGHHVYITDQNHGYEDRDLPISRQAMPERPVSVGDGSWLGHGTVVLPGSRIGRHVVVGANSVVRGFLPDHCIAAGVPARVIRQL